MSERFKVVLDHARRYTSARLYLYLYHYCISLPSRIGRVVSFPSGLWGGAPAASEFYAFWQAFYWLCRR